MSSTPIAVTQFAAGASGFTAQFNQAVDATVLNLYDTQAGALGPADVTVVGANQGDVKGSLVANGNQLVFVKAGGILAPDNYTVTMRSATNGIKGADGSLLDGNGDGTSGDNYVNTFTVAQPAPVVISVADFARGPAQFINPGIGFPVTLSEGKGVTDVQFSLNFDSTLLNITEVHLASGLPAGTQLQSNLTQPGVAMVHISTQSPLNPGAVELVRLIAQVPANAVYARAGVLDLNQVSVNHGAIPSVGDDGIQVVGYLGDTSGNQRYSSLDGSRTLRVVAGLDSGFAQYPTISPIIIGDVTGNNVLSSLDATRILQEVVGLNRPEFPDIVPVILVGLVEDTGISDTDGITSNPAISGTVSDDGTITSFRAGLDDMLPADFVDVTSDLQGTSFVFSRERLEQVLGAPLADDTHTVHLQATDNAGIGPFFGGSTVPSPVFDPGVPSPIFNPGGPSSVVNPGAPSPVFNPGAPSSGFDPGASGPLFDESLSSNTSNVDMTFTLDSSQTTPTITSITAVAMDGTPTSVAVASANAGQSIQIAGTGFESTTEVLFPTRDNAGNDGVTSVVPTSVNADGTLLQAIVPLLASTGQVKVTNTALGNLGFASDPDAIYRNVTVGFTAGGTTATIVFTDEGLVGVANESWGLDNVRVRLLSNPSTVLYSTNFEGGAGSEWNNPATDATTPWTFTEFLGRVSSDGRTLTVSGLTPGVAYQIVTDLYIIDSWEGTAGPDYFDVYVNGTQKFHEAFSSFTSSTQTYAPGASATLQIVPVIYGMNGTAGQANTFDLLGSGFMEGASTITIGGIALMDLYKNQGDDDVFDSGSVVGAGNDGYRISAPLTVEGPIRVTTAGGFYQIAGPTFTPPVFVQLTGIQSTAAQGAPGTGAASANTGQAITLLGNGFTASTLVQFNAQDDTGVNGTLTRTGSPNASGTQLTVIVPELARTGNVQVVGDPTPFALQIVPTLRSISGAITPGSTVVLEGTGLIEGELTILIDGRTVVTKDVRNILDNDTQGFPNSVLDQQIVTLTVPAGVSAGAIQVITNGGSFRIRPASVPVATTTATFGSEIGDTLATAQVLAVLNNNQLTVTGSGLNINVPLDVDMFSFTANAGDVLNIDVPRLTNTLAARLFNAAGVQLGLDQSSGPNSSPRLANFIVPITGTYYLGVSGSSNTAYDPAVAGSGTIGNTATYKLTIKREDASVSSIAAITALAASGTAAQTSLPSANTGQTITLTGSGFVAGDKVVFENVDSNGRMKLTSAVTPATIAADGTSMTVVVPASAATGMVRLARELVGRYLQIVPTVNGDDDLSSIYHSGTLRLTGTGIYEQGLAVSFGAQTLVDRSPITGPDAFSNSAVDTAAVPDGVPTGPFRVTTLGGTSAPFGSTLTSINATATTGTPANAGVASANPGQAITLNGTDLSFFSTDVIFLTVDASGNVTERVVNPTGGTGNTGITVTVPTDAISGVVQIVGDQLNSAFMLQIVPVVTNVDLTSVTSTNASFRLTGSGFVEDKNTIYNIGGVTVVDRGSTTGPDVSATNTISDLTLPYSDSLFGAVTVTTAGGTSAPFSIGFTQLTSVATTGAPANAGAASANPGQTVTLTGTGLTTNTDIVAKFYDDSGNIVVQNLNPATAAANGKSATLTVATSYNGAFALHVLGSSFAPLLQIVPIVTAIDVNGANTAQLSGHGLVEANNTTYHFPAVSIVDTASNTGPDVFSGGTLVNFNLPVAGAGNFTVTTAGGTSAPISWNVISPVLTAAVVDVAYSTAASELLVASSGTGMIYRINAVTGAQIGSFAIPVQNSSNLGLDILPAVSGEFKLNGVTIPTGSLIVFNGALNPDRVVAVNPTTGTIISSLQLSGNFDIVGGAVTATGRMFVLDPVADLVREIDPATGAEIVAGGFAAGMDIASGDIAIHPSTGNIWIASSATTILREYTVAGVLVRNLDISLQGVSTELTGLTFRPVASDFDVLASSNHGVIYVLPDPMVNLPASVVASAGSTVTVPVNIDNGNGVLSATIRLTYDTDILNVAAGGVHLGSLTGDANLVATVDDSAGTIDISLSLTSPLGPGAGSLVDIDYQIEPAATGAAALDLQSVILNDGALILTAEPGAGVDSTDGMIAIQPPMRSSIAESVMSFNPGESDPMGTGEHEVGSGWEDGWRHDAGSIDSSTVFGQRRRKGANPPRGLVAPRLLASEVRSSNRIQWKEKTLDKSIRRTAIRDWTVLN